MVDGQSAGSARQDEIVGARTSSPAAEWPEGVANPSHRSRSSRQIEPGDVDVLPSARACDVAVAQHGDAVADPQDQLLEPVRDVDDRDAARLEVGDDPEQDLDLGGD